MSLRNRQKNTRESRQKHTSLSSSLFNDLRHSLQFETLEDRRMLNGTTIITHGHAPWGSPDVWIDSMATAIQARVPGSLSTAEYTLKLFGDTPATISGYSLFQDSSASVLNATSGEAVLKIDWTELADALVGGFDESTTFVGQYVADLLLGVLGTDFLTGSLHFIGHSRGASVNTALAERLAEHNVWVDQFTTLDPHPVDGFGGDDVVDWNDEPINLWENVQFADNYYREDGLNQAEPLDFDGEAVIGAFNLHFEESDLHPGHLNEHQDVHLWYHGTIDTTGPIDDGEETVSETAGWYEGARGPRDQTGFYFSRVADGNRGAASPGLITLSNRTAVGMAGEQRSNLGSVLDIVGSQSVVQGEDVTLDYSYQATQNVTIYFGYDTDRNPFNGKTRLAGVSKSPTSTGVGIDLGSAETQVLDTTVIPEGDHYLYARIVDVGFNERYVYTLSPLTVTADPAPWHHLGSSLMAQDVQGSDPFLPINPTSTFYQTDTKALWWGEFNDLYDEFTFDREWYRPNGTLYTTGSSTIPHPSTEGYTHWTFYRIGRSISINGAGAENYPGEWRVEISAVNPNSGNPEVFDIQTFTILEDPAVDPGIVHSYDDDSIDFTASDNTQLKSVTIDWFDGTNNSDTWNDLYQSSFPQSVGFDTSFVGTVSYTITAEDTSGNSRVVSDSFFYGNLPPDTNSLVVSPDPVVQPNLLTLLATASDNDGSVVQVEFYRDANANNQLDLGTDTLLGSDSSPSAGWSLIVNTATLPLGTNRYFARAQDDDGDWTTSPNAATTIGMVDPTPPASADFDVSVR